MATCPVCDREWKIDGIELRRNIVVTEDGAVALATNEATALGALLLRPMPLKELIARVYGASDGAPLNAETCVFSLMARLRQKLRPLGYTVENIFPNRPGFATYALKMWQPNVKN